MALIKQIKVGGTTYDIAMKAGNGIEVNTSGVVSVRLASGLFFNEIGEISPLFDAVKSGLFIEDRVAKVQVGSGLSVGDLTGVTLRIGSGFTLDNGKLELILDGTKLKFDNSGRLTLA